MANNYTYFSFAVTLNNPAESEWIETLLEGASHDEPSGEVREVFPEWDDYECLGFDWEIHGADGKQTLYIHDDGGEGNPDFVVRLLQAYLAWFNPTGIISFEFAYTCSKPRPDEFGGGAVVVTADDDLWSSTSSWVKQTVAEVIDANPEWKEVS